MQPKLPISSGLNAGALIAAAIAASESLDDPGERSEALGRIIETCLKLGRFEQARSLADGCDTEGRENAIAEIAQAEARAGRFAEALETLRSIGDDARAAPAAVTINLAAGHLSEAQYWSTMIADRWARMHALKAIANAQAAAGRFVEARATVREFALVGADSPHIDSDREFLLQNIARMAAKGGHIDEAVLTANAVADRYRHCEICIDIAQELAGRDADLATTLLGLARNNGGKIEDPFYRSQVLEHVAAVQAEAGRRAEARETMRLLADPRAAVVAVAAAEAKAGNYEAARELAAETDDPHARAIAFAKLAEISAAAGAKVETQLAIAIALVNAREVEAGSWRAWALGAVATAQHEAGDTAAAAETLQEALAAALTLGGGDLFEDVVADVTARQALAGLLDDALASARHLRFLMPKDAAMQNLAVAFARAGRNADALDAARQIDGLPRRCDTLCVLAREAFAAGAADLGRTFLRTALEDAAAEADGAAWTGYLCAGAEVAPS